MNHESAVTMRSYLIRLAVLAEIPTANRIGMGNLDRDGMPTLPDLRLWGDSEVST